MYETYNREENEKVQDLARKESKHPYFEYQRNFAELSKKHDLLLAKLEQLKLDMNFNVETPDLYGKSNIEVSILQVENKINIIESKISEALLDIVAIEKRMVKEN